MEITGRQIKDGTVDTDDIKNASIKLEDLSSEVTGAMSGGSFETVSTNIKMDGTQSLGSSGKIPNSDHVHPSDTNKISKISSSVDKNIVSWDGTGGNTLKDSGIPLTAMPLYCVDSGSANSVVVAPSPAYASYITGMMLNIKINAANTGAMTINVNSLGAKNIKRPTPSGLVDIAAASVYGGCIIQVVYDGTQFQCIAGLPAVWS